MNACVLLYRVAKLPIYLCIEVWMLVLTQRNLRTLSVASRGEGLQVISEENVEVRFRFYLVDVAAVSVRVPLLTDVHNGAALLGASHARHQPEH
jgi:hypothetical protein